MHKHGLENVYYKNNNHIFSQIKKIATIQQQMQKFGKCYYLGKISSCLRNKFSFKKKKTMYILNKFESIGKNILLERGN